MRSFTAWALLGSLMITASATFAVSTASARETPQRDGPVVVVMDTSGSMNESAGNALGESKIESARSSIIQLVEALPQGSSFGLLTYPGRNSRSVNGCSIGNEEIPIGPLDQIATAAAVRRMTPDGDTPTGPALEHAAQRLTALGERNGTIVLVSDGESNCGNTDVCEVARRISSAGIEVRVNTIGLRISDEGREELKCVANTTGGRYVPADDPQAMAAAIQELSGARLNVSATVPRSIPVASGTGRGGSIAVVTVRNTGQNRANDVRVTLDFRSDEGLPGSVTVPRPVRFLGNLEPGQSRTLDLIIRPDDTSVGEHEWIVFTTATNAIADPQRGTTRVATGIGELTGLLEDVERVAVLGDSYSSGEGAGNYLPNTNGNGGNMCHRSERAYGFELFDNDVELIACSGAVTADFYSQQESGGHGITPQLLSLRASAVGPESPDAVLLSIGGNDIGFGEIGRLCFALACDSRLDMLHGTYENEISARIAATANDIRRVLRDVDRAINDEVSLGQRGQRVAPVIAVPYPRIVPRTAENVAGPDGCLVGLSGEEVKFVNRVLDKLNKVMETSVALLRKEGRPVYYARDVVEAFQPNHTICDGGNSYAVTASTAIELAGIAQHVELLHPNTDGHAAMARAIAAWAAIEPTLPSAGTASWRQQVITQPNFLETWASNTWLSPADAYEAGAGADITVDGFAPTSTVVFRLHSTPRVIGSATADENGEVRASVTIPSSTHPGRHTLTISGHDPNSALRTVVREVRILRPSSSLALAIGICGIILTLAAAFEMLRNRRTPPE